MIKEPEGVDFVVDPTPPTAEELKLISEYIRKSKEEHGVYQLNIISESEVEYQSKADNLDSLGRLYTGS